MSVHRRSLGRIFVVLTLLVVVAAAGPLNVAASALPSARGSSPAGRSIVATPVDETGVTFRAFRSFGYAFVPGGSFWLEVSRTVPAGLLHFAELVGDTPVDLGSAPWTDGGSVNGVMQLIADLSVPGTTAGVHTYQAIMDATDTVDALTLTLTVDFEPVSTSVAISASVNPVQTHHTVTLYPAVTPSDGTGTGITGTIEWRDADTDAVLAAALPIDDAALSLGPLSAGLHHVTAAYSGDTEHAPSVSPVFTLTVVNDVVQASGLGMQYTTFYPIKDGYRDSVGVKGVRAEPISVAIRIYNSGGTLVRSATIPRATGAYAYLWNGRTSAGSIRAAGKYKVVQTLTDAAGLHATATSYVNLSHKKLVTHTTYVTKRASSLSAKGHGGTGSVTVSTSAGTMKLKAGTGYAIAGWEFSIPAATIYKSVGFQVYAKAPLSTSPTEIAIQNFTACPRTSGTWSAACFDHWRLVGNSSISFAWFGVSSASPAYRSGRYVRGLIGVAFGTTYVNKVRAKVVYQTLE
jgi:hypothetical protein